MGTIAEVATELERGIQKVIGEVLPQARGYAVEVEIRENDRKKRSTASVESWNPATGKIVITFGNPSNADWGQYHPSAGAAANKTRVLREPMAAAVAGLDDLILALEEAEQRPGFDFVSLKWFRDTYLPSRGYAWAGVNWAELIRDATEEGVIMTRKVPNPKTPAFPVTAVSLNRQHPDVREAVSGVARDQDFQPVPVRGEPISATIIRDRR